MTTLAAAEEDHHGIYVKDVASSEYKHSNTGFGQSM